MTIQNVFVPQQGQLSNLAGWIAGDLGTALARLYASNTPYLPTRTPADYTEASFPGYAPASPLSWGAPFTNGDGKAESDSATLVWTFSGPTGTYPVFGIYLTDPGATKLIQVIPFLQPFTFTPTETQLSYQLQATGISELQS